MPTPERVTPRLSITELTHVSTFYVYNKEAQ